MKTPMISHIPPDNFNIDRTNECSILEINVRHLLLKLVHSALFLCRWCNFPDKYAMSTFIPPIEKFYKDVSSTYTAAYINEYGTDHLYNIDLFNELRPNTGKSVVAVVLLLPKRNIQGRILP